MYPAVGPLASPCSGLRRGASTTKVASYNRSYLKATSVMLGKCGKLLVGLADNSIISNWPYSKMFFFSPSNRFFSYAHPYKCYNLSIFKR